MFLGLVSVGTLSFYFPKKHILYVLYIEHISQVRALAGPIQGPDGEAAGPGPGPGPGRTLRSQPGPLPSRPGRKYVAQGTLAAIKVHCSR